MVCRKYHLEKIMQLQTLLGVALPIVQAPMAGVQDSALALAVSNAGGLGSLPCAMLTPNALRQELEVLRHGTDRPFNLNFFAIHRLHPMTRHNKGGSTCLAVITRLGA